MAAVFAQFVLTAESLAIEVDGSVSAGPIISYVWDWGDGSPTDSGVTSSHVYAEPGDYLVSLTVTDGVLPDTSSRTFHISFSGPASSPSPRPIQLGLEVGIPDL